LKLLLDMNISPRLAAYLRDAGFDAVHWADLGEITANDPAISSYAATAKMVVITHDLDFGTLLVAGNQPGPSVIQIRADDLSVDALGDKLLVVLEDLAEELEIGALITFDTLRVRVRILPLSGQ
jgi:predicted nuclease of predicted toxin-antitoxin system